MTSDNDGESVLSSGSGRPSPVPGAKTQRTAAATAGCKGILVHNNKKSANTNRVSFVANSSSSTSLQSSSAPPHRPLKNKKHQDDGSLTAVVTASAENLQLPYYGRRLTGFGIKSYLHEFYDDPEYRDPYQQDDDDDYDDDFRYCVEPEIRWRRHCGGVYMVLGLAVMTVGAVAMAAGHLIPARDPVVGRSANMEVIDRWAVAFNENLASCRYIGSMVFAVGVVFTVVRFWVSVISDGGGGGDGDDDDVEAEKLAAADGYDYRDLDDRRRWRRWQRRARKNDGGKQPRPAVEAAAAAAETVRIPITGSVENVQPDPRAISLQIDDSS